MATDHNFRIKNGLTVGAVEVIDSSGKLTATAFGTNADEKIEDVAAAMITGATHSNITVTYDDTNGTLAFSAAAQYGDSDVEDYLDGGTSTPSFASADINGNTTISGTLTFDGTAVYNALNLSNNNIYGVNNIAFADPGPNEGLTWSNIKVYESPNDLSSNSAGNLQVVYGSTRRLTVSNSGIDVNGAITSSGNLTITPSGSKIILDAYNTTQEGGGIFFREGFSSSNIYNLSIIARSRSNDGSADGLSINAYEGITFSTGSNSYNERLYLHSTAAFTVPISTTGAISGTSLDTGQGANELYAMNQNVRTTDSPTFSSITSSGGITATLIGRDKGNSQKANINFWDQSHATYPGHVHIVSNSQGSDGTYNAGDIKFWNYNGSWANIATIDEAGNLTLSGTVDGRDIATDGTKLDTIATNADVTPSWVPSSDPSYATQSYVGTQISNLVDSAPTTLDTLNELAAALGDDANFSTTVTNSIATKLPLAGGTITGAGTTALTVTNTSGNGGYFNVKSNVGGVSTDGNVGLHIGWNKSNGGREINMIFDGGTTQADTEMIFTSTDGSTYTDIFQINGATSGSTAGVDIKTGGLMIGGTRKDQNWDTAYGWGNHASAGYLTSSSTQSKYLRSDTTDVMAMSAGTNEMLKFQNNTSGGHIQLGFQQQDTDGLHHRLYLKAYKGSGTASGNVDIIVRGSGGSTTSDVLELHAGQRASWQGNDIFTDAYHPNADKWTTSRTLTLGGDLSGNVSFDGSANFTLTAAVADDSHNHIISNVDGLQSALDGKTSLDHFRHTGTGNYTSTTTSALLTEALGDDAFDSYLTAHKTSWSYAGNGNLTDAGRLTELAGTSWLWWTDNSADNVQGNITGLCIAPTTGGSAGKMFVYNNQGSGYAPGWREIWTSTSDGASSGLDADLLDGSEGSYYLDYNNFTNTPTIPNTSNFLTSNASDTFGSTTSNQYIRFNCNSGQYIASGGSSSRFPIEIYAPTTNGGDAALTFHINNDYAAYFGLASDWNDLAYGGWSVGATTKHRVLHTGNYSAWNRDDRYYTESESDAKYLLNTSDDFNGTLTIHSGGTNSYGRIRGYGNDNHFITMRGTVSTGTSTLSITGGHRMTFCEHAENNDTTGWYFISKQSGNYTEIMRITRTGGIIHSDKGTGIFSGNIGSYAASWKYAFASNNGTNNGGNVTAGGAQDGIYFNGTNGITTSASGSTLTLSGANLLRSDVSDNYAGRTLSFGVPGQGTTTTACFASIEGNTDSSGEGSGRLFFREHNSTTTSMDGYGMSLGYRGGSTSVTTAGGNTWTGLSQIGNGEWGMWGHNGDNTGNLIMHGPRDGSYLQVDGDLEVNNGATTTLSVRGSGTGQAKIWARCSSQGTGMVMVSQDDNHGGGIEYNGDNNPSTTGAGSDQIALFRVEAGTYSWTARNAYNSNDWSFRGNVTAYASDERLKENIAPINNAVEKVKQLRGVTFDWKDDCEDKGFMPTMKHETGVIAQDVQKVIPDAAVPAPFDEDYLTVKHEKIIPVLIEAIKEQQEQIEELKSIINTLVESK